ncbi:MAG: metal ABC transporter permease [Chloroflexota bacterium]|nr:metal ABC transporter permease [Chloroflexota bacterium]
MQLIESLLVQLLTRFISPDTLNAALTDPRTVAVIVGVLVATSSALLGNFLLLRKMSLTTDAISHTILLGIVSSFLFMALVLGIEPDLASPWLIIGAALAGVATVVLTEAIQRSGLVKGDAALGLAFPLLFAIGVLLVARFTSQIHLDADSVLVGEIGLAWTNTNSYCLENCEGVTITPEDPRAETARVCTNCQTEGISPRSANAVFEATCANCGTYTAAEAWRARLIAEPPQLVYFPKAISTMGVITLINLLFVLLFYKELKLATFDRSLALSLGFRPGWLHYALMILVSVTAVGAFDAVGSILVVAFFVIPAAAAYLLTDRLWGMLLIAPIIGAVGAYTGYDLARGSVFGLVQMNDVLTFLDRTIGLGGHTQWDSSISAAMVLTTFLLFVIVWVVAPQRGLISTLLRRRWQREQFATQVLLGHLHNHASDAESDERVVATLHEHLRWTPRRVFWTLARLRASDLVDVEDGLARLTERGRASLIEFHEQNLATP